MKVLIIGHGGHGKDTVAGIISELTGLTTQSSSKMAAMLFIYDILKHTENYNSFEECYYDRRNKRELWYSLICDYNRDDRSRLAKDLIKNYDIYVGMRDLDEFIECKNQNLFDLVIGVFDPNKPLESKDSFKIDIFKHSDFIVKTGNLEVTKNNVKLFSKILL